MDRNDFAYRFMSKKPSPNLIYINKNLVKKKVVQIFHGKLINLALGKSDKIYEK